MVIKIFGDNNQFGDSSVASLLTNGTFLQIVESQEEGDSSVVSLHRNDLVVAGFWGERVGRRSRPTLSPPPQ